MSASRSVIVASVLLAVAGAAHLGCEESEGSSNAAIRDASTRLAASAGYGAGHADIETRQAAYQRAGAAGTSSEASALIQAQAKRGEASLIEERLLAALRETDAHITRAWINAQRATDQAIEARGFEGYNGERVVGELSSTLGEVVTAEASLGERTGNVESQIADLDSQIESLNEEIQALRARESELRQDAVAANLSGRMDYVQRAAAVSREADRREQERGRLNIERESLSRELARLQAEGRKFAEQRAAAQSGLTEEAERDELASSLATEAQSGRREALEAVRDAVRSGAASMNDRVWPAMEETVGAYEAAANSAGRAQSGVRRAANAISAEAWFGAAQARERVLVFAERLIDVAEGAGAGDALPSDFVARVETLRGESEQALQEASDRLASAGGGAAGQMEAIAQRLSPAAPGSAGDDQGGE